MARAVRRAVPKKVAAPKCGCNPGWLVVGLIFLTLGLFALVEGFKTQFNSYYGGNSVILWYFVGIILLMIGKMAKWKSHSTCTVHNM